MPSQVLDIMAAMAFANGQNGGTRQNRRISIVQGEPDNKQFRIALLNGFGQFFIVLLVLAGYQVYLLLESFLRPLAWAVITGIVLFPFKTVMSGWAKLWVDALKSTNTPLALGIVATPLKLADLGLDHLGDVVLKVFKDHTTGIFWGVALFLLTSVFQLIFYISEVDIITSVYGFSGLLVRVAASNWVWSILIAYGLSLVFLWEPRYKERICALSLPIACAIGIHLTAIFGAIALPFVVFIAVILGIGFLGELKGLIRNIRQGAHHGDIQARIDSWGKFAILSPWNFAWWPALVRTKHHISTGHFSLREDEPLPEIPLTAEEEKEEKSEADRYIISLLKFFLLVQLWKNITLVPLLVFPTVYSFVKQYVPRTWVFQEGVRRGKVLYKDMSDRLGDRKRAMLPTSIIGLYRMALYGDQKILNMLSNSIDEAASNLIICIMFVTLLVGAIVVVVQVQQETSYLVRMSGLFLNKTLSENPQLLTWIPGGNDVQNQLQNSVDSLYTYSRQFISDVIKGAVASDNSTHDDQVADEIMSLMDQMYYGYMQKNETVHNITEVIAKEIPKSVQSVFSWSFVTDYVYNHFESLYSVLNSAASFVTENAALIAGMATSVFSFIITYFSQFMDFIMNAIFYLASLSFLLSLSGERYFPLDKISQISDYFPEAGNVAEVIESTITGIFSASIKMALFYSVYVYTLLSIFEIYVRFLPACIAGIFAIIPLFPTYMVCIPGLIEILFVRQDYFLTGLLLVGAYLPSTFVDEVMYQEVKTVHPYMFGLSVAGGLLTMGIEGVVVGPIVLCAFVTAIELSRMILKPAE